MNAGFDALARQHRRRARTPAPRTDPASAATAGAAERPRWASRCACGGSCPRCGGEGNRAGAVSGVNAAAAPAPVPAVALAPAAPVAPAPAPAPLALTWNDAVAPTYGNTPGKELFRWVVNFSTNATSMWLVQHIRNTWDVLLCGDPKPYQGWTAGTPDVTPDYWEAWWVDANGAVQIPKSTATPPASTGAPVGGDDHFVRQPNRAEEPTEGLWGIVGDLYLVPQLPAQFKLRGVPDARHLAATTATPTMVGATAMGTRDVGGTWAFCNPNAPIHVHS